MTLDAARDASLVAQAEDKAWNEEKTAAQGVSDAPVTLRKRLSAIRILISDLSRRHQD